MNSATSSLFQLATTAEVKNLTVLLAHPASTVNSVPTRMPLVHTPTVNSTQAEDTITLVTTTTLILLLVSTGAAASLSISLSALTARSVSLDTTPTMT